jgi:cell division septal protein FtsQ
MKRRRRKKRKSFFKNKTFCFFFLGLIFIGSLFYLFFFSSVFQVEEIKVEGNNKVSEKEIKEKIEENLKEKFLFLETKSIFTLNIKELKKEILSENILIESLNIEKNLPKELKVIIRERQAVALFRKEEKSFLLDKNSMAFQEGGRENLFLLKKIDFKGDILGKKIIEEETFSKILKIKESVEKIGLKVLEAEVRTEKRIDFKIERGFSIYFNLDKDLDWQITELKLFFEKEVALEESKSLNYIDLRFEKLFYK